MAKRERGPPCDAVQYHSIPNEHIITQSGAQLIYFTDDLYEPDSSAIVDRIIRVDHDSTYCVIKGRFSTAELRCIFANDGGQFESYGLDRKTESDRRKLPLPGVDEKKDDVGEPAPLFIDVILRPGELPRVPTLYAIVAPMERPRSNHPSRLRDILVRQGAVVARGILDNRELDPLTSSGQSIPVSYILLKSGFSSERLEQPFLSGVFPDSEVCCIWVITRKPGATFDTSVVAPALVPPPPPPPPLPHRPPARGLKRVKSDVTATAPGTRPNTRSQTRACKRRRRS